MIYLEFEKPLAEIEGKAEELRALARTTEGMDISKETEALDRKAETALRDMYGKLTRLAEMSGGAASRTGRIARITSKSCSPNTRLWPATAPLPMTMR